jgi:RNA polymerase sigma factor (sigma-70 family)
LDSLALTDQSAICDIDELYTSLADRLERLVRVDVRASDALIEDACQFAWIRLVHHRHRVNREAALSWLVRTAVREAFKLIRRESRELSLDGAIESAGEGGLSSAGVLVPGPEQLYEQHERLHALRALPERQQRFLWLHGLGLSYDEMARHENCTLRTVERQLLRATHAARELMETEEGITARRANPRPCPALAASGAGPAESA